MNDLIFLFHIFPSYFLILFDFLLFHHYSSSSTHLTTVGRAKRLIDSSRFSLKEMVKIISFFFFFFLLFCLGGIDFRLRLITMSWRYMMMPDGSPATPACWPGPLNYSDSDARCYLNNTRKQRYTGATHAGRCCCCCVVVSFFFFKFFFRDWSLMECIAYIVVRLLAFFPLHFSRCTAADGLLLPVCAAAPFVCNVKSKENKNSWKERPDLL